MLVRWECTSSCVSATLEVVNTDAKIKGNSELGGATPGVCRATVSVTSEHRGCRVPAGLRGGNAPPATVTVSEHHPAIGAVKELGVTD
jgi:hypothetical protein